MKLTYFSYEIDILILRYNDLLKKTKKTLTREYVCKLQPEAKLTSFGRIFRIDENSLGTHENFRFVGQA